MKRPWLRAGTALLLGAQGAAADVDFSGYAKAYGFAQEAVEALGEDGTTYHLQSSVRLMLDGVHDDLSWQLHYELSPIINSSGVVIDNRTFGQTGGAWRITDLEDDLADEDSKNQLIQNLDRLNVQWRLARADITVGRQPIAFGAARAVNPTDVFLPFDVRVFSQEYRVGVDAVRVQTPLGDLGELDGGFILGEDDNAAFVQGRVNMAGSDVSFVAMDFADLHLLGGGLQRSIGPIGVWLDAARVAGDQEYWRVSVGSDMAFSENTLAQLEFHYNGAGSKDPDEYLLISRSPAFSTGGVYLFGTRYLIPAVRYTPSAIWTFDARAVMNLDDSSTFYSVTAELNVAEDLYCDLGIYYNDGDELDLSVFRLPKINSEFGTLPSLVFVSLRFYF